MKQGDSVWTNEKKNLNISTNFLKEYKKLIWNKNNACKTCIFMRFITYTHKMHIFNVKNKNKYMWFIFINVKHTSMRFMFGIYLNWLKCFGIFWEPAFNFLKFLKRLSKNFWTESSLKWRPTWIIFKIGEIFKIVLHSVNVKNTIVEKFTLIFSVRQHHKYTIILRLQTYIYK